VILNDSISVVVIGVCSVWCRLFVCMVLGFFLGRMVMYLCMSHSVSISKSCGAVVGSWLGVVGCFGRNVSKAIGVFLC